MSQKTVKLFNTMGRELQDFKPIHDDHVGLYSCGPTVYNYAHIGNLRSYVFADILRRGLEYFKYDVKHVMNITDVGHLTSDADSGDDKMEKQAAQTGMDIWEIAQKYTDAFFEHTEKLNILRPKIVCKATDHIKEQIEMVQKLEEKGYAYVTDDGVYFDSAKYEKYGALAKLDIEGLRGGERVDLAGKKNKTDFALWKFSNDGKKRQMEWESPWGIGFPGWHIECSAMSMKYLGETFDIHTGGIDHIPVHHTNEIAQSECATGKGPFANFWMHGEFLVLDKSEKMSKSSGNFLTLDSLIENGFDPIVYRLFLLGAHYRSSLKFSFDNLKQAQNSYKRLKNIILEIRTDITESKLNEKAASYLEKFENAVSNDLDMPEALSSLWQVLRDDELNNSEKYQLALKFDLILGLGIEAFEEEKVAMSDELEQLLEMRQTARANKDWAAADKARDEIHAKGYKVVDSPEGAKLEKI
jgi:cysteinyl-tRNA synthetase